jgi:hypothetical protein
MIPASTEHATSGILSSLLLLATSITVMVVHPESTAIAVDA